MAKKRQKKPVAASEVADCLQLFNEIYSLPDEAKKPKKKIHVEGPGIGLTGIRKMLKDKN